MRRTTGRVAWRIRGKGRLCERATAGLARRAGGQESFRVRHRGQGGVRTRRMGLEISILSPMARPRWPPSPMAPDGPSPMAQRLALYFRG